MPSISVIIPYYNVEEKTFARCVDSVLNQEFHDFEVIVVNDGSAPEYKSVLSNTCDSDNRIRVIDQKNKGVSAARNSGVKEAKGDYIVFLDADDALVPYFFSEAFELCIENDIEFLIGGNVSMERKQKKDEIEESFKNERICEENKSGLIRNLVGDLRRFGNNGGYIGRGPFTRFVKREIAVNVPFDEELHMDEDIVWNIQMVEKCKCIYVAYRIWYLYFSNPSSSTHKYNPKMLSYVEKGLGKLESQLNLNDHEQYIGYCCHLLEELRKVYVCFIGNKECNFTTKEKKKIISGLYKTEPWTEIKNLLSQNDVDVKTRLKSLLYITHSFFFMLRINTFMLRINTKNFRG